MAKKIKEIKHAFVQADNLDDKKPVAKKASKKKKEAKSKRGSDGRFKKAIKKIVSKKKK